MAHTNNPDCKCEHKYVEITTDGKPATCVKCGVRVESVSTPHTKNRADDWQEDERKAWENIDKHDPVEKMMRDNNLNSDQREEILDYWLSRMSLAVERSREEEEQKFRKILNSGRKMYELGIQEERSRLVALAERTCIPTNHQKEYVEGYGKALTDFITKAKQE
jgi:hypothetical protein